MKRKLSLHNKINRMFERSNKLNKRSLALWKQSLKLRQKADKLLTDSILKDKKQNE